MPHQADLPDCHALILSTLEECAVCIRKSRFDDLPAVIGRLESQLAKVVGKPDAGSLKLIRARIADNRRLLLAAVSGARAAARRIAEVTSAAHGVGTYDRNGQRARPFAGGGLEIKA